MAVKPRSAHLHAGPGFRVKMTIPRPPMELLRGLAEFPTPDISDLLNRLYAVDPGIHVLSSPQHKVCGPACTVKVFPGDNLLVHKSLDVLEPGDVVIIDAGGSTMNAVLGDLISTKAKHRGAQGFVVDGLVRDLPSIVELDLPVFARGTTPIGPLHRGPGEINFPICCGGVVVNPGDIVVGDAMGVVIVPQGIAADLLQRLQTHEAANADYFESVKKGNFSNAWVDKILIDLECPIVRGDEPEAVAPQILEAQAKK
jgi:RraA family protein